jgi:hypothetical protein
VAFEHVKHARFDRALTLMPDLSAQEDLARLGLKIQQLTRLSNGAKHQQAREWVGSSVLASVGRVPHKSQLTRLSNASADADSPLDFLSSSHQPKKWGGLGESIEDLRDAVRREPALADPAGTSCDTCARDEGS